MMIVREPLSVIVVLLFMDAEGCENNVPGAALNVVVLKEEDRMWVG